MIPKELLDLLCCPKCRAELREETTRAELVCTSCGARYPIRDGIPILLPDPPPTGA